MIIEDPTIKFWLGIIFYYVSKLAKIELGFLNDLPRTQIWEKKTFWDFMKKILAGNKDRY